MEYAFQKHQLTEAERLWLTEVAKTPRPNARVIKVRLLGKIPSDFDSDKIDRRIWFNEQLTLIGRWLLDPRDPIFEELETIVQAIREKIIKNPGIDIVTATEIASLTGLEEKRVESAIYQLGQLPPFATGAAGAKDNPLGYSSLSLTGDKSYDGYLGYDGIWGELERYYLGRAPTQRREAISFDSIDPSDAWEQPLVQTAIKRNTAFVLMAIDPEKPEIEDVYTAIRDVCRSFGIEAYRANDVEHQDSITTLILQEIVACEHLIADVTYERPNVYYEIGFAHAVNKKPILYRRNGTRLHFDLSVHNVPEYKNTTELRELLKRRLEAILGRTAKAP